MAIVEVENLSAGYENGFVLHDVSFSLEPGEFAVVLGKNGSGKSTLIKALQKLTPGRRGRVRIESLDSERLGAREIARRMAYVPQLAGPVFDYSVEETVSMGRFARRKRLAPLSQDDRLAIDNACSMTGICGFRTKPLSRLSGGESQRVFIARALAQDTAILLLDEPSLHLDINFQVEIFAMLKHLQREHGKTLLVAEHNINLAAAYAGRLLFLKDGRLVASGPPAETINRETIKDIFGAETDIRINKSTGLPEISLVMEP